MLSYRVRQTYFKLLNKPQVGQKLKTNAFLVHPEIRLGHWLCALVQTVLNENVPQCTIIFFIQKYTFH